MEDEQVSGWLRHPVQGRAGHTVEGRGEQGGLLVLRPQLVLDQEQESVCEGHVCWARTVQRLTRPRPTGSLRAVVPKVCVRGCGGAGAALSRKAAS